MPEQKASNRKKQAAVATVKDEQGVSITEELQAAVEEALEETKVEPKKRGETVVVLDEEQLFIGETPYRLIKNHRDAFQPEVLGERYSSILNKYDYIVADWGYDQLRLKGFYGNDQHKVPVEQRIVALEDYLYEYCNFGCAYFVLERIGRKKPKSKRQTRNRRKPEERTAHQAEKKAPVVTNQTVKKKKPVIKNRREEQPKNVQASRTVQPETGRKSFTIRKKEE